MKKTLTRVLAMVLCVAMTITMLPLDAFSSFAPLTAYATDVEPSVTNPGFENGTTGWTKAANGKTTADNTYVHSGEKSLKMTGNAIAQTAMDAKISVVAGKKYEFSAYFYTDNPESKPQIDYYRYKSDGTSAGGGTVVKFETAPTSGWTKLSGLIEIPEGTVAVRLSIPSNNTASDKAVWLDSVLVEEYTDSNRVFNGNFEDGTLGWTKAALGAISADSTNVHSGGKALKATGNATVQTANNARIPVEAGKQYEVSAYFFTDDPGAAPEIDYYYYDSNGKQTGGVLVKFDAAPTSWTKFSGVLEIPAGIVEMRFSIPTNCTESGKALWIDSVSLVALNEKNLVANGSFEPKTEINPTDSASAIGWNIENGTGTAVTNSYRKGIASLKMTASGNNAVIAKQSRITILGGYEYNISAYVCTDSTDVPSVNVQWYKGDTLLSIGGKDTFQIAAKSASNEWQKISGKLSAPSDATAMSLSFVGAAESGKSTWIDEVSVSGAPLVLDISKNLTVNGDFEGDVSGWSGNATIDTTKAQKGTSSAKLAGNASITQSGIPVIGGKDYEIKAFVLSSDTAPYMQLRWYCGDTPVGDAFNANLKTSSETEWTSLAVVESAPVNATALKVEFVGNSTADKEIWIDSISVKEKLENIVMNSSFESNSIWRMYSNAGGTATYDTTQAHTGKRSAKLSLTSKGRAFAQQSGMQLNSDDQSVYRLSAWYRAIPGDAKPQIRVNWYGDNNASLGGTSVYIEKDEPEWVRVTWEAMSPVGAKTVQVYPDIEATSGTLWFDDITFGTVTVPMTMTGKSHPFNDIDFEESTNASSYWELETRGDGSEASFDSDAYKGNKSLKLTTASETDSATATQFNINSTENNTIKLIVNYKTANMVGNPYLKFMWYDKNDNFISSFSKTLAPSDEWTEGQIETLSPKGTAKCAIILGVENGAGTVWFDDMTLGQYLTDADGHKHYVTNVVDITESFYAPEDDDPTYDDPQAYWAMFVPAKPLATEVPNIWTEPFFRTAFFGNTGGQERGFALNAAPSVIKDDETMPVVIGSLGMSSTGKATKVIDPSIVGRPIMSPHGSYTDTYAPRREFDYIRLNYLPNYVMTGNEYFSTRAKELLTYLDYSQWKEGGRNAFVEDYYTSDPNAANKYVPRLEWRGAFTIFDWIWKDVPGYTWTYHEGDHHTNSLNVTSLIRAYELFGDEKYFEMAREFVYYQFPRYGFHSGEWNGQKYYWTEYNPTGDGNPTTDAIDNAIAHCASAATMVGYYEKDPVLREQLLEFGRGCLWYLVREYSFDRRFWYDGAEYVEQNKRKAVSHENSCLGEGALMAAYLYKAGVDISAALEVWEDIYKEYPFTFGSMQCAMYLRMVKVYDGTPAAGAVLPFTTFFTPTTADLTAVRFSDTIPEYGFEIPTELNIRFSRVTPPDNTTDDWHVDPDKDVVYTVTPAQLAAGVEIPFDVKCGEIFRATYELKVIDDPSFNREDVEDTNSEVTAWRIDEENNATFVNLTSGNSILLSENGATKPIAYDTTINTRNCLSYGSQLEFRFDREMASEFVDSPAPMVSAYLPTESWRGIEAEKYIYPAYSMAGSITNGVTYYPDYQSPSGGALFVSLGASADFDFEIPSSNTEYTVDVLFNKARSRGVVDMYINDVKQGETQNLYRPSSTWVAVCEWKSMGTVSLIQGINKLSFAVVGKNPLGNTNPGFSEIVLTPVGQTTDEKIETINDDEFVIAEHDRVMRSTNTKLRLDTYIVTDNPYVYPITWTSSNPSVATVNDLGVVTAISNGKTVITATSFDESFRDSVEVTVRLNEEEDKPNLADVDVFAPTFYDVDSTYRYFDDVVYVSSTGLMNGTGNNMFSPDATITRGMIVTILYRLAGQPTVSQGISFSDVANDAWYATATKWASANGIVEGYTNGKFMPNEPISREQLAAIMYRYAIHCGLASKANASSNLSGYTDASSVSDYAKPALNWALGQGVMQLSDLASVAPRVNASRGEVANVFHNICTLLGR